ncbi:MAG: CFI-box-CTERM domain-containing protein [Thermodesulfobacteriota bacterium]|nr:CFI-box-CTERM domain-containing protein [Thermodesulfobacteriota bacterium]
MKQNKYLGMKRALNILSLRKSILFFVIPFFLAITQSFALDVTLQWDANTEIDLAGYRIYYGTETGPPYNGAGSPINVSFGQDENPDPGKVQFTVSGLANGEIYFFAITAYDNENPSLESGYSNEVFTGDTDEDGMPDWWELKNNLNPAANDALEDPDNDGYTNLEEYLSNTDPNDGASIPQPPIANAGPTQEVGEGVIVTLNGLNSFDPDGTITYYEWNQISGNPITLSNNTIAQPTFTSPEVDQDGESLTFQLTVTDNGGLQNSDTCIVNVTWENRPPVANAGDDQVVDEGVVVTLDGNDSTDPDGTIVSYIWTQVNGVPVTLSDPSIAQPTFTSPEVAQDGESLTFQLTVTDNGGLQNSDTCIVNVTWENRPPVANAGNDQEVDEGVVVTLNGSDSIDPDGTIVSYLWTQVDGVPVTLSNTTTIAPTFVTPPVDSTGATLTFELTVQDNGGLRTTDDVSVTVNDNGITGFPDDVFTLACSTGEYIGVKLNSGGAITNLCAIDPGSIDDITNRPENLLYGLLNILIRVATAGDSAELIIYLPTPAPVGFDWYKHDITSGWINFSENIANALFNPVRDQITLNLVDGGAGDADGVANRVILDPSGLGVAPLSASGGGGGCFISTAAYGSPMASKVKILCQFRDEYLRPNVLGRKFVALYEKYSPPLANHISKNDNLKAFTRLVLWPTIVFAYLFIHTSVLQKIIFMSLMLLLVFAGILKKRKAI